MSTSLIWGNKLHKTVLLAAVAVLALSGCAPSSNDAGGPVSATAEPTTLQTSETPAEPPTETPTPTPTATPTVEPAYITYTCSIKEEFQDFTDYRDVWATKAPVEYCDTEILADYDGLTATEQKALAVAYGKEAEVDQVRFLYGICAQTAGIPIDKTVSSDQAEEAAAAIMLCPNHPKVAAIKKGIAAGQAASKADAAIEADRKNGKFLTPGSYLVGKEAVPGTWQSQGERVENCYWETSDANGNIIANNYINVAPQFTITVPATAAGLTLTGCSFRWVGP